MPDTNPNIIAPGLPEKPDERRRLQVQWSEIEKLAETAAGLTKNQQIQERLKDPDMRAMILGLVERQEDGSIRFLPDQARPLLREWNPAFRDLPQDMENVKALLTDDLKVFLDSFTGSVKDLNEAFKTPNVTFPLVDRVRAIIAKLPEDQRVLQPHLWLLVDALQAVISAPKTGTVQGFLNALPPVLLQDAEVQALLGALNPNAAFTQTIADKLIADIVKLHPILLDPQDRTDLEKAARQTEKSLETLDKKKRTLIADKFQGRAEYLRLLTGSTVDRILAMSTVEDDKIDFEELKLTLLRIGIKDVTVPNLQVAAGTQELKVKLDDAGLKKLSEYLRRDLKVENSSVFSVNELLLKGMIPQTVSLPLSAAYANASPDKDSNGVPQKPGISAFTLAGLADIESLRGFPNLNVGKVPERILELVSDADGEDWVLDEKSFMEIFTFLNLKGDWKNLEAKDVDEARGRARAFLTILHGLKIDPNQAPGTPGPKVIMNQGDQREVIMHDKFLEEIRKFEIGNAAKDYITAMDVTEFQNNSLWITMKKVGSQTRATGVHLTEKWLGWAKGLDELVWYPELDQQLRPLIAEEDALEKYRDGVRDVLSAADKPSDVLEKSVLPELLEKEEARAKLLKPLSLAATPKEKADAMKELLLTTDYIIRELNDRTGNLLTTLPVKDQKIAVCIALNIGISKAEDYVRNPNLSILSATERLIVQKYLVGQEVAEANGNILSDMREKLGVSLYGGALPLLAYTLHEKECVPLAMSSARLDNWFVDSASAGPALDAILMGPKEQREALIGAFTSNAEVIYGIDPVTQEPLSILPAEARKYVLAIKEHLGRQTADYNAAKAAGEQKNRFTNPLDLIKSGGKELIRMINSRDTTEKILGYAIIFSAGYLLWSQWKQGGIGKKLMLGIPLFLGADILVNRLTGQGILERAGLNYMDPKQRSGVLEQFIREKGNDQYAFMKTDAGEEAVDKLTSSSEPLPVSDLIEWRRKRGITGRGDAYALTAPLSLRPAAEAVVSKMSGLDKQGRSYEGQLEMAYEYLYLTFDSLCGEVAVLNGLGEPGQERGANLIEARYVNFNEPYMTPDLADAMKRGAPHPCGFTMLDVLVFERKTPAMSEDLLQNDTFLEWVLKGTGIAVDEAKLLLKQGYSLAQIYTGEAKRFALRTVETGKGIAIDSWEKFVDWYALTKEKGKAEISDEMQQTLRSLLETLSGAGLYLIYDGPKLVVKLVEGAGALTRDVAQAIYLEVETHMGTGNMLFAVEEFFRDRFGWDMGTLLLEEEIKKNADKLTELAERRNWFNQLRKQLNAVVEGPQRETLEDVPAQSDILETYLIGASRQLTGKELEGANIEEQLQKFDELPASVRMATYELVKRRLYSKVLAARTEAVADERNSGKKATFPLIIQDWPSRDLLTHGLEHQIDQSYGSGEILLLLEKEKTPPGDLQRTILEMQPSMFRTLLDGGYKYTVGLLAREEASEYVQNNPIIVLQYYKNLADKLLRDDPKHKEKLDLYNQYLDTVITNILVELTFPAVDDPQAGIRGKANVAPLLLTVDRAGKFLEHLQNTRTISVEPDALQKDLGDLELLKVFASEGGLPPAVRDQLRQNANATPASVADVSPELVKVTQGEKAKIDEALKAPAPINLDQLEILVGGLGLQKGLDADHLQKIQDKLEEGIKEFINSNPSFADQKILNMAGLYLRGVDDQVLRKQLEEKVIEHFTGTGTLDQLKLLAKIRENEPREELRARLQEGLDRALLPQLKSVVERMKAIPKEQLVPEDQMKVEYGKLEDDLLKLYEATNMSPDRTSDLVSRALEWLWYKGASPGYDEFANHLKLKTGRNGIRSLAPTPKDVSSYSYKQRNFVAKWFRGERSSAAERLERDFSGAPQDYYLNFILEDIDNLSKTLRPE